MRFLGVGGGGEEEKPIECFSAFDVFSYTRRQGVFVFPYGTEVFLFHPCLELHSVELERQGRENASFPNTST